MLRQWNLMAVLGNLEVIHAGDENRAEMAFFTFQLVLLQHAVSY